MDAHSHDRNMLHKCNRARRENVASDILFYIIGHSHIIKRHLIITN